MVKSAREIWRLYETDGVPASGPNRPNKRDILDFESNVETLLLGMQVGGGITFTTAAEASASLGYAPNTMALVVADGSASGIYQKKGFSGSGFWLRIGNLPYSFARYEGAGTANAIAATSVGPPSVIADALLAFSVPETNTSSAVTVSFNGGAPLSIKTVSGNPPPEGSLTAGSILAGYISGSSFRLITDIASASIQAAAEAAAEVAEAARDEAVAAKDSAAGIVGSGTIDLEWGDGPQSVQEYFGLPSKLRVAANVRGKINFFDFLHASGRSSAVREQIANGSFTGDLAVEWQAFRDALWAVYAGGGRPFGFIPECRIFSSVAPNFAMDYLTLDTQGQVQIEAIGNVAGFLVNGEALGVGGYGVRYMHIGPLCASSKDGSSGILIRYAHQSEFNKHQSRGASFAGMQVHGCVSSVWRKPSCQPQSEPFIKTPSVGLYVSGTIPAQTSWCMFDMPIFEYMPVGIQFDNTFGNTLLSGTAEGCTNVGMIFGGQAVYNKLYGIDFEANANYDVICEGRYNEFYGVDSGGNSLFDQATCYGNRIFGGHWDQLTFSALTKMNLYDGIVAHNVSDNSFGPRRNRGSNIVKHHYTVPDQTVWGDGWSPWSPAVVASSGTTAATAAGEYKVRDGDTIDFQIEIDVSSAGTGSGELRFNLPDAAAIGAVFAGVEAGISGKAVRGSVAAGQTQVSVRFYDATYPGQSGAVIILSGAYRRA